MSTVSPSGFHYVWCKEVNTEWHMFYRHASLKTSVSNIESTLPVEITLEQNYPNPFNPGTAISFQQSAISYISLKVYDIYGKEVVTLINNKQYEAGKHSVEWNAEGFPSGIYFYRLSGTYNKSITSVITKKMLLIK